MFETFEVWIRKALWAVAVAELVFSWAVASVSALLVAGAFLEIVGIFFGALVLAERRVRSILAIGIANSEGVLLISLASGSFIAPDRLALDLNWWGSRLAPVKAWASAGAARVAGAFVDTNGFLVLTFGKTFAVAIALRNTNVSIVSAAISALLSDITVLAKAVFIWKREGWAVRVAKSVGGGASAAVGANSVAGTKLELFGVFSVAVVLAESIVASAHAFFSLSLDISFAGSFVSSPDVHAHVLV